MSDVSLVLLPRAHDVGGFEVRRALPAAERQMVGPFIFFDQMGPGEFLTGRGLDVRPHPHIGLSTVTSAGGGRGAADAGWARGAGGLCAVGLGGGVGGGVRAGSDADLPGGRSAGVAGGGGRGAGVVVGRGGDGRAAVSVLDFVSSSRERIEQAKAHWRAGRFGSVPGDEREFIPRPEGRETMLSEGGRVADGGATS